MIVVIYGQPHSGKTTLAKELCEGIDPLRFPVNIDGDKLRSLFNNKDFSREGRIKNLNRASDIAVFLNSIGHDPVLSLVYPYKETRDYLNSLCDDVKWIFLTYHEIRGREKFHVEDFEEPENESYLHLPTSEMTKDNCLNSIKEYIIKNPL